MNNLFFIKKFIGYTPTIFDNDEVRGRFPWIFNKDDIESILK